MFSYNYIKSHGQGQGIHFLLLCMLLDFSFLASLASGSGPYYQAVALTIHPIKFFLKPERIFTGSSNTWNFKTCIIFFTKKKIIFHYESNECLLYKI